MDNKGEIVFYQTEDNQTQIEVRLDEDTVWLNQFQMLQLFDSSKANISEHINSIYKEGELEPTSTVRKFRTVQKEGSRDVTRNRDYYNLDVIISVVDGNKRIAASIFLYFLEKNSILQKMNLDNYLLVALTLMIANSKSSDKDLIVNIVSNILRNS